VRCNALPLRPRSYGPSAALAALPLLPAPGAYSYLASAAIVAVRALSYRAAMSMHLWPNPAVNSDAPLDAFVLSERPQRRAGYLIR